MPLVRQPVAIFLLAAISNCFLCIVFSFFSLAFSTLCLYVFFVFTASCFKTTLTCESHVSDRASFAYCWAPLPLAAEIRRPTILHSVVQGKFRIRDGLVIRAEQASYEATDSGSPRRSDFFRAAA